MPANDSAPDELQRRQILRFALGVTVCAAIAFAYRWPMFFLAPVLTAFFLAHPVHGSAADHARQMLITNVVAFSVGLAFAYVLLPYPLVFTTLLALALFRIYHWGNTLGTPALTALLLLAVTLVPMASLHHDSRASGLLLSLSYAGSAGLAIVLYLVAHVIIPDRAGASTEARATTPPSVHSTPAAAAALKSTLVVLPIAIVFLAMNWASELPIVIFAALFSLAPRVSASRATGLKMLGANLIGGAAALVFYWLIVAVPEYPFFIILMFLTMLTFGSAIFTDSGLAKYMTPACIAVLVLIGGSMTETSQFIDKPLIRVAFISIAVVYTVTALALLDDLFSRWRRL